MKNNRLPGRVSDENQPSAGSSIRWNLLWELLLVGVLIAGGLLRLTGVNWDENQHLHPDERFLTMVETAIAPVENLGQYFDTQHSSLNPHNRGYSFYVYGTLPLFMVRYLGEWLNQTGYDEIALVGRQVSALMDLGTVFLVYCIANRLFRKRPLALLAAAFAAFSVLPIQLSHYFTVDPFTNFFGMLAFLCAAWILPRAPAGQSVEEGERLSGPLDRSWRSVLPYAAFGVTLGLAMACKINAVFLAVLLPGAALMRWFQTPEAERQNQVGYYFRRLILAAILCLVIFRIFQPYAFTGPGFLGVQINPKWLQNMRELAGQSTGDVDFPPALQWARRPITFAWQNMVLCGLGLPLGLLAWAGFLGMGYRILRGNGRPYALLWGWTGLYFAYQSYNWTRSMRYQMLVYPTLAIIAAWAVCALWARGDQSAGQPHRQSGWRIAAVSLGGLTLFLTAAWAYAFIQIYQRPMTRVAASRWIYQNVPGPINLRIQTDAGTTNQPLAFRSGYTLQSEGAPLVLTFKPREAGYLAGLTFEHVGSADGSSALKNMLIQVREAPDAPDALARSALVDPFTPDGEDPRGRSYTANFDVQIPLDPQKTYWLSITLPMGASGLNLAGPVSVEYFAGGRLVQQPLPEPVGALGMNEAFSSSFMAVQTGTLQEVALNHVVDWEARPEEKTLRLELVDEHGQMHAAELQSHFSASGDPRGAPYSARFDQPVPLQAGAGYTLRLIHTEGAGRLAVYGSKQANESSWDDALPVGLDGYNPYDYTSGVYRSDLNFEMYWDDNAEKLARFETTLDQADYLFISSNRQWGTTVRVPERYPLTSEYYRQLLGCPADREITWCYSVAQPGQFQGNLGFTLQAVFQSDPNLGSLRFNDQFAEEAFTVYDHPKVLIFKKNADYNANRVNQILSAVDLTNVVHLTPRKASQYPGNLQLPTDRLTQQQTGGTWRDLFPPDSWLNRFPGLAAVAWYLTLALVGWGVYPLVHLALRSLPDRGFPLARMVGLLLAALPVWWLGSTGVPFSAATVSIILIMLLGVSLAAAYWQRADLLADLRQHWKQMVLIEALFLACFTLFLLVRLGNPDLWHPWKGGEKPMDFAYFNAVLKSTSFPPYDPWFAGGYINYYYYGFVIFGTLVKWLGITPAVAYNLILPTLFALLAAGAFSIGWNLVSAAQDSEGASLLHSAWGGLAAALGAAVLGNLGTLRMIWQGIEKLAVMTVPFEQAGPLVHLSWLFQGLARLVTEPGLRLPYGVSDWYWIPSRAYLEKDITEFPAFSFIYADLHAHVMALAITALAIAWALSFVLTQNRWKTIGHWLFHLFLGGVVIGALRVTNTWDWPTYLALSCAVVVYTGLRYPLVGWPRITRLAVWKQRLLFALGSALGLVILSVLFYAPFDTWYGQGYNQLAYWDGYRTPFGSYLVHWGVFLFVIVSWMAWETVDWMAHPPVAAAERFRSLRGLFWLGGVGLIALLAAFAVLGVSIAWLALPLLAWAGFLFFKNGLSDAQRFVLFLVGTALLITLFVEVVHLPDGLDRMNTIFKFYLQAWVLLAVSAGACFAWILPVALQARSGIIRNGWWAALTLLVGSAGLFPVLGGLSKMEDRMASNAPHSLDGMAYMEYSSYTQNERPMDLSQDARAIRWMQQNVAGSPVIVEAATGEYNWGSRYSIYTGLPDVIGWNWHQRQQRAVTPDTWVYNRIMEVGSFYEAMERGEVEGFLRRYDVRYIVVGQLERDLFSPAGLEKFDVWNGSLWDAVYRDDQTVIYKVKQ